MKFKRHMIGSFIFLLLTLLFSINTFAAPKLSVGSGVCNRGETLKCKVTGTKQQVKWSTSNKNIAVISSKGILTGKKEGTVNVIAKVGKKTLKKKVRVQTVYFTAIHNKSFYDKYKNEFKEMGMIYSSKFKNGKFTIKGSINLWNDDYLLRKKITFPKETHTYKVSSKVSYFIAGKKVSKTRFTKLLNAKNGLALFLDVTNNTIYSMSITS